MVPFPAVVATGNGPAVLQQLRDDDLPDDPITVDVAFSSLNYKDGLAVTGKGKIARRFPMTCGIDLAGTVAASDDPAWPVGSEVVVTGWGLAETHPGGYTHRQRLPAGWLLARPDPFDLRQCMAIGTAGVTAALSVLALERAGVGPDADGEVLVTGAGGGVGSVAVALLANGGYRVAASTGRAEVHGWLRELGASSIVDRAALAEAPSAPLAQQRWAGAIDTVGGTTLATVLTQLQAGGAVAACGLAGGSELHATVFPFILRGVALLGIDSVQCPNPRRRAAWDRLGRDLPVSRLESLSALEPMSAIEGLAEKILAGQIRGRVVIDPHA